MWQCCTGATKDTNTIMADERHVNAHTSRQATGLWIESVIYVHARYCLQKCGVILFCFQSIHRCVHAASNWIDLNVLLHDLCCLAASEKLFEEKCAAEDKYFQCSRFLQTKTFSLMLKFSEKHKFAKVATFLHLVGISNTVKLKIMQYRWRRYITGSSPDPQIRKPNLTFK